MTTPSNIPALVAAEWSAVASEYRAAKDAVSGGGELPQHMWDRLHAAVRAVSEYPVSSVQHLAEKMDMLVEEFGIGDFGGGDEAEHVYADLKRLTGKADGANAAALSAWRAAENSVAGTRQAYDLANANHDDAVAAGAADTASLAKQSDDAGVTHGEAEWALLLTAAPHVPALVRKLEWLLEESGYPDNLLAVVRNDIRGLLGEASA